MTEFKPGDVALVECSDGKERVAICGTRWIDDSLVWLFQDKALRDVDSSTARPLVVIDPEDHEAVDRLIELVLKHGYTFDRSGKANLAAALREFADPKPPKPVWTDGDAVQEGTSGPVYVRGGKGWSRGSDYAVDGYLARGTYRIIRRQSDGASA